MNRIQIYQPNIESRNPWYWIGATYKGGIKDKVWLNLVHAIINDRNPIPRSPARPFLQIFDRLTYHRPQL